MMHALQFGVTLVTVLVTTVPGTDSTAVQRFDRLVAHHIEQRAQFDPEWATSVGLHTADSLLTDRSLAGFRADSIRIARQLKALQSIDTAALDSRRRIDWLLLRTVFESAQQSARLRTWERRPGTYVPFGAVYALAVGTTPAPQVRMAAAIQRLERWPAMMALGRRQIDPSRTPAFWVKLDVANARNIARYLKHELPTVVAMHGGDTARFSRAQARASSALSSYIAWMSDTLAPQATGDWALGRREYDWQLQRIKLLDTSADSLIGFGRSVFAETEYHLAALARSIDSTRSWQELADSAKGLHPAPDSVFEAYAAESARARDFIIKKQLFQLPPNERLEMVLTPPNLRQTYAYGGYSRPAPFAPEQVGRFFVTPVEESWSPAQVRSKLRGHNYGWITVVAVHEGYPGHHLQSIRASTQPNVLRRLYGSDVFGEGWGLYAEELMYQNGFYPDSLARLTQLRMRLWRAARVIIDPAIHTGQMTFDEAVRFLTDAVGLESADATAEVTRYTTWPTQAISYIIGMHAIESLRDEVQSLLGSHFDQVRFHDAMLSQGSLPPPLMRRAVLDALHASTGATPGQ